MPWWGWITLGGLLLIAELVAGGALYLLFVGIAAILVGILVLPAGDLPFWAHWLIFAVLALALLIGLRRHAHERINRSGGFEAITGEHALVIDEIAPSGYGQASLRGAKWAARNVGRSTLTDGQRARVERVDGLTLEIRAEEETIP
ncbi:MAG: NfeD family protein [Chloroflexota bacterium]|nr:NfeD family protein [Chloroflexota bacterium]